MLSADSGGEDCLCFVNMPSGIFCRSILVLSETVLVIAASKYPFSVA